MTVLMEKMMTNDWIYGHTMFRKKNISNGGTSSFQCINDTFWNGVPIKDR